jgi:2-polyprenyl-6-methoxyphenol hydroxylase-like FAD-dependent oxidoreductase
MSTAALSKGDAAAAPAADAQAASQQQYSGRAHALPAGMLVTQADVEAALVALLLDRFGITVQRNTSLASFAVEDDSSSVLCTLISTSGTASGAAIDTANGSASGTAGGTASIAGTAATQQFRASYLIGCDGGKSSVRKLLGLQFAGTTLDQRWLLGDFKYELDESVNAAHRPQHPCEGSLQRGTLFVSPTDVGLVGLIPLGKREGEVRIIWNAGGENQRQVLVLYSSAVLCKPFVACCCLCRLA